MSGGKVGRLLGASARAPPLCPEDLLSRVTLWEFEAAAAEDWCVPART